MSRVPLLLLGVLMAGCLPAASAELSPPYRQGLIDPEWDPLAVADAPRPAPDRRRALRRCRQLEGRTLATSVGDAERQLLVGCLGRRPELAPHRERAPRLLDVVIFDGARPAPEQHVGRLLGVVVAVSGERVEFLYARAMRARLGVLSLRHPDRRRTPGGSVENTYLRVIRPDDPKETPYLAGQLLAGFADAPL